MTDPRKPLAAREQLSLFPGPDAAPAASAVVPPADSDADARRFAVDPGQNVVLEASAGTGKTTVLVARYVNLLNAGVDPVNILALTFTRKAAAEMRDRIIRELREASQTSAAGRARWHELRDRLGDISVGTIDAFCLSLLREFPLEADLDPGFDMADETEVPRIVEEALDHAMRIFAALAVTDSDVALVLAQLGASRTRDGLALLLDRRLVASDVLDRFLARGPADLTAAAVCRRAADALADAIRGVPGGLASFLADGPHGHARYLMLVRDLERLTLPEPPADAELRAIIDRLAPHFLTGDGKARTSGAIHPYKGSDYPSPESSRRHRAAVFTIAPRIEQVVFAFARDLNAVLARGIRRTFAIALEQYRRALDERSVLDFSDVLQRALELLGRMDEFAQSRFRLEARYHHLLVDEFQDTSRAQWELVALLIRSWGEGLGLPTSPSIFIVGDRKQSIYRFRDADVGVLDEAARFIEKLRPQGRPRRHITRSFRAVPQLLSFVNELFSEMSAPEANHGREFVYGEGDRFPIEVGADVHEAAVLGIAAADDPLACARAVANEIARIVREEVVRDRRTGLRRQARPGDMAILFRSRTSHREFEGELERLGIPAYVYKGLGFFDADETRDVLALIRYLAEPASNLRAAAFLRSRFLRLSDAALASLAPHLAGALLEPEPDAVAHLGPEDRSALDRARLHVRDWLARADRVGPAELIETILDETAYAFELRGPGRQQALENLKKLRALIRRVQNRGFATLRRLADHLDSLTAGDESNAVLEALDAVNLMTVHASKGLEFPVVFVVNLARGATGPPRPIRLAATGQDASVAIGPFVSETDELEREADRQETRRLLYVALTRARDRLYLSSVLKDGILTPGRGSLAEVLPATIRELFVRAATSVEECPAVAWTSSSGITFDWRVCRAPTGDPRPVTGSAALRPWARMPASAHGRVVTVSGMSAHSGPRVDSSTRSMASEDAIVGSLVHRLIQSRPIGDDEDDERLARLHLREEEQTTLLDPAAAVRRAVAAWRAASRHPDLLELLREAECLHEVPFSMAREGRILRGRIDCLVRRVDGTVIVVELKTGRPLAAHREQLDVYLAAARLMYPAAAVEGRLVYL